MLIPINFMQSAGVFFIRDHLTTNRSDVLKNCERHVSGYYFQASLDWKDALNQNAADLVPTLDAGPTLILLSQLAGTATVVQNTHSKKQRAVCRHHFSLYLR